MNTTPEPDALTPDGARTPQQIAWTEWCRTVGDYGKPNWVDVADGDTALCVHAFNGGYAAGIAAREPSAEERLAKHLLDVVREQITTYTTRSVCPETALQEAERRAKAEAER